MHHEAFACSSPKQGSQSVSPSAWTQISYSFPINKILDRKFEQQSHLTTFAEQTLFSYFSFSVLVIFYLISSCQHHLYDYFKTLPKCQRLSFAQLYTKCGLIRKLCLPFQHMVKNKLVVWFFPKKLLPFQIIFC